MNSGRNVDMIGWTELFRDNGWWMSQTDVCYWIITEQNAVKRTVTQWITKRRYLSSVYWLYPVYIRNFRCILLLKHWHALCLARQVAQLSQRNRAAEWVSFGWVVSDDVGQTILCNCRCQKTKSIDLLHDKSTFIRKTITLRFWAPLWGRLRGNVHCSSPSGGRHSRRTTLAVWRACVVRTLLTGVRFLMVNRTAF